MVINGKLRSKHMFAGMVKKKKQLLRNNADTFILPLKANRTFLLFLTT